MRNVAYAFLVVFLIVATIALVIGVVAGISTLAAARSVTEPIGDLVRELVVEATPVILPNPVIVLEEISSLARLETTSYAFQDILEIERNPDFLWGTFGESLLFVAYGEVIAGVDLEQLRPEDVQVISPTTVMIHLPEAELFFSNLDNQRSHVADRDVGFFADADPELETVVRREAEKQMTEAALANGILELADEEAQLFMGSFIREFGFEEVIFTDESPPPAEPYIQVVPKGHQISPVATPTP